MAPLDDDESKTKSPRQREDIEVTPLSFVPGMRVRRYVGRVNVHLIKEAVSGKDKRKRLGTFAQIFIQEALSIGMGLTMHVMAVRGVLIPSMLLPARSHVHSMGGNALIGLKMESVSLSDDDNNYCLISLSGDAVCVRKIEEQQQQQQQQQQHSKLTHSLPSEGEVFERH
jgi:uncharacterized protein YbjQ (UPF0145 family)